MVSRCILLSSEGFLVSLMNRFDFISAYLSHFFGQPACDGPGECGRGCVDLHCYKLNCIFFNIIKSLTKAEPA